MVAYPEGFADGRRCDCDGHLTGIDKGRASDLHLLYKNIGDISFRDNNPVKRQRKKKKPPIGLMPKALHEQQRVDNLKTVINRYLEVEEPVPVEWIVEYNERVTASGR